MLDREWSRSRFWLSYFLHSRHEHGAIDWRSATCEAVPPAAPVIRFLNSALPGQMDDGRWLIAQALRHCPSDPAYIQALRLFTKEEARLRTVMGRLAARAGLARSGRPVLERAMASGRRVLGLRFELSMLLQDELVDVSVFALVRDAAADDPVLAAACRQAVACRQAHAAFHAERLTVEFADFNFIRRNLRRWRLRLGFALKLGLTMARYRGLIRAAGQSPATFVRAAWSAFAIVLGRLVPYRREAQLAALLHQTQRPYDQPNSLS
jgi:hypothetical protein